MKKLQTPILGLFILLAAASCRKDFQENVQAEVPEVNQSSAGITKQNDISQSDWQANFTWTAVEMPSHAVFYTNVKTDIPAATAEQGLVRVFKSSDGKTSQSLPFEETVNGQKHYWYYQVTEGNIMISVDVYGSKQNPVGASVFKSVVLSKESVSDLESKGTSRARLMSMPAETITSIQ